MQKRFRAIVKSKKRIVYGLTMPEEIALFFSGCYFTIEKSGTCIVAYSGACTIPTKEQIKNYNFEDCRI